ncbi:MAG: Flp pilus assembly complex ATPase component TadA [Candidatus Nomurabacteria bacterium]|jgi:type IV pilus assembly protein PilB|nr:Flp pilus assembly complex ATPase component TadA [Candidatus Nomurabacteria bacterium]
MNLGGQLKKLLSAGITSASFKRFIADTYKSGIGYIHLDPQPEDCLVRTRSSGQLSSVGNFSHTSIAPLITFVKTASGLKAHRSRLPDESSFDIGDFQIRVFSLPVTNGEKLVLQITKVNETAKSLSGLGFGKNDVKTIQKALKAKNGLILALGEDSQRVIFGMLAQLDARAVSISTIEHQRVLDLPLANQFIDETNYQETAPSALKIAMRQGSDVIALSRLDTPKLASLALDAGLSGKLILASLPISDAFLVPDYMTYLGVPLFLLSSQLRLIVSKPKDAQESTNAIEIDDRFRDIFIAGLQPSEMRELYESSAKSATKGGGTRKSIV